MIFVGSLLKALNKFWLQFFIFWNVFLFNRTHACYTRHCWIKHFNFCFQNSLRNSTTVQSLTAILISIFLLNYSILLRWCFHLFIISFQIITKNCLFFPQRISPNSLFLIFFFFRFFTWVFAIRQPNHVLVFGLLPILANNNTI